MFYPGMIPLRLLLNCQYALPTLQHPHTDWHVPSWCWAERKILDEINEAMKLSFQRKNWSSFVKWLAWVNRKALACAFGRKNSQFYSQYLACGPKEWAVPHPWHTFARSCSGLRMQLCDKTQAQKSEVYRKLKHAPGWTKGTEKTWSGQQNRRTDRARSTEGPRLQWRRCCLN